MRIARVLYGYQQLTIEMDGDRAEDVALVRGALERTGAEVRGPFVTGSGEGAYISGSAQPVDERAHGAATMALQLAGVKVFAQLPQ